MGWRQRNNGRFGVQGDGVLAGYCSGILAGLAAAADGRTIRARITNLADFPGLRVKENGEHNWPTLPEVTGDAFVSGIAIQVPELLMRPRWGAKYRVIFDASEAGAAPGVPDGAVIEVSLASVPTGFRVTIVDEHGNVEIGRV
jgi:hypothetical protein